MFGSRKRDEKAAQENYARKKQELRTSAMLDALVVLRFPTKQTASRTAAVRTAFRAAWLVDEGISILEHRYEIWRMQEARWLHEELTTLEQKLQREEMLVAARAAGITCAELKGAPRG